MSDDEDDPFERLDESVDDREGDPFERLGNVDEESADTETEESWDDQDGWMSAERDDATGSDSQAAETPRYDAHDVTPDSHRDELEAREGDDTAHPGEPAIETDGPTVRTNHGESRVDPDDPFGDVGTRDGHPFDDDVFEQMDTEELDPDEVWQSLSEAEERGSVSQIEEQIYAEVSKHRFCEHCEFFSDPPDVRCTHEGTEILEFVDNETVRVVDCPVVAERKELERHE